MGEFSQLFDGRVDDETRRLFSEVDMDVGDGKLTRDEFVAYHLDKFSALSDAACEKLVAHLTAQADEVVVIDDEAAVVE